MGNGQGTSTRSETQKVSNMKTWVYVLSAASNTKRVGWIAGTLENRNPMLTKRLVKFLDGSDSQLVQISRLQPMTDIEKVLWKITD